MKTANRTTYCTFRLDDLLFGVDVLQVQEVIRLQRLTRVPLASEKIVGLMNLRGQVVTAIDLRRRLEMKPRTTTEPPVNVVVRTDDEPVALLVDDISDVVELDDAKLDAPPVTLVGPMRELVAGVHQLPDRLLRVLDLDRALDLE